MTSSRVPDTTERDLRRLEVRAQLAADGTLWCDSTVMTPGGFVSCRRHAHTDDERGHRSEDGRQWPGGSRVADKPATVTARYVDQPGTLRTDGPFPSTTDPYGIAGARQEKRKRYLERAMTHAEKAQALVSPEQRFIAEIETRRAMVHVGLASFWLARAQVED